MSGSGKSSETDITHVHPEADANFTHLLMCAPDHYGVEYEINPWMHKSVPPDSDLALRQWRELHRVLTSEIGCRVALIQQVESLPDMVFTANAGLVDGTIALLSRFRHTERGHEEVWFHRWFESQGYRVHVPPEHVRFEGEGDALIVGDTVLAGYLKRSDIESHAWISQKLERPVISLALVDSRWYHLDTCLFAANPSLVVFYPGAFDTYGQQVVKDMFDTIEVSESEALQFACNSVVVGRHVVMPSRCPSLTAQLQTRGFDVHPVDMSEFIKTGGAAKCLTLFLTGRDR